MTSSVPRLAVLAILLCANVASAQSRLSGSPPLAATSGLPGSSNSAGGSQTGETLLRSAVAALDAHQAVSAKLRQQVDLFGHRLVGSGGYLQQGRGEGRLLRLELKIQVEDQVSSLQQVCDGRYLWMHQDLLGKNSLGKIDVRRVQRAWRETRGVSTGPPTGLLALGGLPQLLTNLNDGFNFRSVTESKLDGLSVWSLQGEWEKSRLVEMLPAQKARLEAGQPADLSKLAPQVPERVTIMLGRDDLFPYRIEYARRRPLDLQQPEVLGELKQVVLLELFEVQLNVPADPRQFVYNPGGLEAIDQTAAYLKSLNLDPSAEAEPITPANSTTRPIPLINGTRPEAGRLVPIRR